MKENNRKILLIVFTVIFTSLCITASTPILYSLFCKATGYGGTVDFGVNKGFIGEKNYIIKFNADTEDGLNWKFESDQNSLYGLSGENQLAFYTAENLNDFDVEAMAIYNVTPHIAGKYFKKVDCFCFEEQNFKAKEKRLMPVVFFIDPKIEKDPSLKHVDEITLSYTFFKLN